MKHAGRDHNLTMFRRTTMHERQSMRRQPARWKDIIIDVAVLVLLIVAVVLYWVMV